MAQLGIEKVVVETNRRRVYISDSDLLLLSAKSCRKLGRLDKITKQDNGSQEEELYTIADAAKFLNVSVHTVKNWLSQDAIEKQYIVTDIKRVYISYRNLLLLALKHGRTMSRKDAIGTKQADNGSQAKPELKDLYTIEETAQLLGVAKCSISRWIEKLNISKNYIRTDRRRVYIQHSDVLLLADQYRGKSRQEKQLEKDLYSTEEIALLLSVSKRTVRKWIAKYDISKKYTLADKRRMYIQRSDVLMLASQRRRYWRPQGSNVTTCGVGVGASDRKGREGTSPTSTHLYPGST